MSPQRCYVIWFSQRCGSTLLAGSLAATGCAGNPQEWLNSDEPAELIRRFGVGEPADLLRALWRDGTTANGVFGLKYGVVEPRHGKITDLLRRAAELHEGADEAKVWRTAFPDCRHLFMTRRNKVRLAVSWWRAIQSGHWHQERGAAAVDPKPAEYSFDAIAQLVNEATLREAGTQAFFDRCGIVPMTIVYEDMIAAYEPTVRAALAHVGVEPPEQPLPAPAHMRMSDATNDDWAERYRQECQRGWTNRGW